jgi:Spy/CpxP family protein refolding chaperone
MIRVRSALVPVMALVLAAAFVAAAQGQATEGARRGSGRGLSRGSLLGLIRLEQVQKELKLSEEQATKVNKVTEELTAQMREQYTALREIEDREKRRAKMTELADQFDGKVREQLRDVLAGEQMTRLYQIRTQVRAVVESLGNTYVAGKLKLTDQQKEKVARINKDMQAKRSELFGAMRDATQEQRAAATEKLRKIRSDADKEALAVLTAEQSKAFQQMQGEKIELEIQRGRR